MWRQTKHEWGMNIHYQNWIAQGWFTNIIHTPLKQWGVCEELNNEEFHGVSHEENITDNLPNMH